MKLHIASAVALVAPLLLISPASATSNQCQQARKQEKFAQDGYNRCYNGGRAAGRDCGGLTFPQWSNLVFASRDKAAKACRRG